VDSTSLLKLFRTELQDLEDPPLWANSEVLAYMDDAQKMFCRLTVGLGDASTPSVTCIAAPVGGVWAPLSPLILKIRAAYRISDGRTVDIVNYEDVTAYGCRFNGNVGPLRALIIGMQPDRVRFWPIPSMSDSVQLIVDRLPLVTIDDMDLPLEIAEQHHRHLLHWMKHLAYSKQDAETFHQKKASDYETDFRAYCEAARQEKERAMHKTRVVRYGGL
jgi:hypothetical protein